MHSSVHLPPGPPRRGGRAIRVLAIVLGVALGALAGIAVFIALSGKGRGTVNVEALMKSARAPKSGEGGLPTEAAVQAEKKLALEHRRLGLAALSDEDFAEAARQFVLALQSPYPPDDAAELLGLTKSLEIASMRRKLQVRVPAEVPGPSRLQARADVRAPPEKDLPAEEGSSTSKGASAEEGSSTEKSASLKKASSERGARSERGALSEARDSAGARTRGGDQRAREAPSPRAGGRVRTEGRTPSEARVSREETPSRRPTPVGANRIEPPPPDKAEPGIIMVTTTPPGLVVRVDGQIRGLSPARLEIEPGPREIAIANEDRVLLSRRIDVLGGRFARIEEDVRNVIKPKPSVPKPQPSSTVSAASVTRAPTGASGPPTTDKKAKAVSPSEPARAAAPAPRGVPRNRLREVLRRAMPRVRRCYERELTSNPKLAGEVVVQIKIATDGTVDEASFQKSTLESRVVKGCILRLLRRLRFPRPLGGPAQIAVPLVFAPKKKTTLGPNLQIPPFASLKEAVVGRLPAA